MKLRRFLSVLRCRMPAGPMQTVKVTYSPDLGGQSRPAQKTPQTGHRAGQAAVWKTRLTSGLIHLNLPAIVGQVRAEPNRRQ